MLPSTEGLLPCLSHNCKTRLLGQNRGLWLLIRTNPTRERKRRGTTHRLGALPVQENRETGRSRETFATHPSGIRAVIHAPSEV